MPDIVEIGFSVPPDSRMICYIYVSIKLNSVARPPLVGVVSANFCGIEGVAWSAQRVPTAVNLGFIDPEPLLFYSSTSSVILTRLS
jgi:hypothetical protein